MDLISPSLRAQIRASWRVLLKELTAFGVVGAFAFAIDVGIFNALAGLGWVRAKAVSATVSTAFAYVGNRNVSFSHRARTGVARETSLFFAINLITLVFSLVVIGLFAYPLGQRSDHLVMNLVNLATIAVGTIFRFWSYKRFVFLHPDRVDSTRVGLVEELAD
jgi:putative flippase GtrA